MTHLQPIPYTNISVIMFQMGITWWLTQHSLVYQTTLQTRFKSPSRLGQSFQVINKNEMNYLHSRASLFHIVKLQNGACAHFKDPLADFVFRSQLLMTKHAII